MTDASAFLPVNIPSSILSQPIRYNKKIKINSKPIYTEKIVKQNIIFLIFLTLKMSLKGGRLMKISCNLSVKSYFQWRQIVHPIPKTWK